MCGFYRPSRSGKMFGSHRPCRMCGFYRSSLHKWERRRQRSMSGSISEADKARFVAKLGPMLRFREAEKTRFVAQLGPMLRFSGRSAKRTAKCLRTMFRAWAWLGAGWAHGLAPGACDHQPTFEKCEGSPAKSSRSYAVEIPQAPPRSG